MDKLLQSQKGIKIIKDCFSVNLGEPLLQEVPKCGSAAAAAAAAAQAAGQALHAAHAVEHGCMVVMVRLRGRKEGYL